MNSFEKAAEWVNGEVSPQDLLDIQIRITRMSHRCCPTNTKNYRVLQWENKIRCCQNYKWGVSARVHDFDLTDEDRELMKLAKMQKTLEQK